MEERGLDAIVVAGRADEPNVLYVTGGIPVHGAVYVKKRGQPGVLCHGTMERGEAEKTGLRTRNLGLYNWKELMELAGGDPLEARVLMFRRLFDDEGVRGRVAFYGEMDQGAAYRFLSRLASSVEGLEVVGEYGRSVLAAARETKDPQELEKIREVGRAAQRVVARTAEFLRSCSVTGGVLVSPEGGVVTIGEVKGRVRRWLAEEGLEGPGAGADEEPRQHVQQVVGAGAADDVGLVNAQSLGQGATQLALPGVGVEVQRIEAGQGLPRPRRRPVGVLVAVQLDDGLGRQAQLPRHHLRRVYGLVALHLPQVGAGQGRQAGFAHGRR